MRVSSNVRMNTRDGVIFYNFLNVVVNDYTELWI